MTQAHAFVCHTMEFVWIENGFDVLVCQVLILSPTCMAMAEATRAILSLGGKRGGTGLMLSSTTIDNEPASRIHSIWAEYALDYTLIIFWFVAKSIGVLKKIEGGSEGGRGGGEKGANLFLSSAT